MANSSRLTIDAFLMHPIFFSIFPLIFLWFFLSKYVSNQRKNQPPSPPGLPIIGNLHQLNSLPHYPLQEMAKKYGPIMLLKIGSMPTIIISSADAASQIMKTHDLIFSDRPFSSTANRLLYNMKDISVAPYGEYWRQLKSICVLQLLSNKRVQAFRNIREEETAIMMEKIKDSSSTSTAVNLSEMFVSLTNDVVCRSAFGKKYGEGEKGKKFKLLLAEFLQLLNSGTNLTEFVPWLRWINRVNGFDDRVDRVAKEIDGFLEGVLQERLDGSMENSRSGGEEFGGENREDFLDILLRIYKGNETGVSMDRDSVKAIILDVFSAGTDTTATVAEWTMTEILRHPIVTRKLQDEIRGILGDKQQITEDDLEKMHYFKAVIKESLRLHPPIPLLVPRLAREDVRVMGYEIAAGTTVIINAGAIGRDPSYWDEPEKFKPERFMNSNSVDFKGHDFQLIPFGAGRRGCPGIAFAMASNELVLANMIYKFDWKLPNGAKGEELDMTECPGVAVHRKIPLLAIPTPLS
ncbi:hypothetical protein ACH5RR_025416 [Cinchona calisaya]|uniref:Cytochrome P450 n=1 Tax=Cinchona calisaya TaxID=153742 RepID=A0ABD2YZK1_9GENT